MPFYLLFQQFLFVQGGSVGEPIFVIVGPIWSHEGILKEYKKKSGLVFICYIVFLSNMVKLFFFVYETKCFYESFLYFAYLG